MPNTKEQLVRDVEFIFLECMRLNQLAKTGIMNVAKEDLWYSIPHPRSGQMLCGRAAWNRLEHLATMAGERSNLLYRVENKTLREPLSRLLVQRFMSEQRPIDVRQVERVLSSSAKQAREACVSITHLVPCHLMHAQDPPELPLGPVTFLNRASFRALIVSKVRSYRRAQNGRVHLRWLLRDALTYYRNFKWVAKIQIDNCDSATGRYIANSTVVSALDCLHLVLGAQWTDRMRVGGPAMKSDNRARLTLTASGSLDVSVSRASIGQVNFEDGWSKMLNTEWVERALQLCAVALEVAVNPDVSRPLSRRFLDAAQWFGEAVRDDSPSTRVVKLVTALERMMVMTEEKDDITRLVSERVAALCFRTREAIEVEAWRNKALRAYRLRSKLVHGALSPRSPEVSAGVALSAELAGVTLISALIGFSEHGLRLEHISSKRLGRWFSEVVSKAEQITNSRF